MSAARDWTIERLERHLPPEPARTDAQPVAVPEDERLVVLDDDPTGGQTVHGVDVLAHWGTAALVDVLRAQRAVFLLTNSRALAEPTAVALYREIAEHARAAGDELGVRVRVASRSDSTLRGHFAAEVDALVETLGADACLFVPCFVEGGRLTFDDTHWVREGDALIPAGETPYSDDATFAYSSSHLPSWVEEKTRGRVRATDVPTISIDDLRLGGPDRVADILTTANGRVVVSNAVSYPDLEVLVEGVRTAEAAGRSFVYRCAASFVRVRAGVRPRSLLDASEVLSTTAGADGGLVVCGSHVPKTTAQLQALLELPEVEAIELDVPQVLASPDARDRLVHETAGAATAAMEAGQHAVVYTSRNVWLPAGESQLDVGADVSSALVDVVRALEARPAFFVAKGGITAHDLATKALEMRRATVLGQIQPGVPVWHLLDGPAAGTSYVVFPGNVGDEDTLATVVRRLAATPPSR